MGASSKESIAALSRLKREDCERTKHDSAFSDWKILIGPSDWEDHSLGREGAERYRVHNLPNCASCQGVYELGVALPRTHSSRQTSKLEWDRIIVVYLGQADNVRTRLQQYGRGGAHLVNGSSTIDPNDSVHKGPGLFKEIFSRGYAIAFRWAPMKSKRDAEKTEAQLLNNFDYAWNKGNNGIRRPNHILEKLDLSTSGSSLFPAIARKLQVFHQKKVGIKIEASQLPLENGPNAHTNWENHDLLSRIFKIGRSLPRPISLRFGVNEDNTHICGVALGQGIVCRRPPAEGRKRCAEHKWMKVNGFTSKLIEERTPSIEDVTIEFSCKENTECAGLLAPSFSMLKPHLVADYCPANDNSFPICGVTLHDGSTCGRKPVKGRKRCEVHKGMSITYTPFTEPVVEWKQEQHYKSGPIFESSPHQNHLASCRAQKPSQPESPVSLQGAAVNKDLKSICGVFLENGTFCTRPPVKGRMRCEEHKGMRVNISKSNLFYGSHSSSCSGQEYSYTSSMNEDLCGAALANGSSCRRPAAEGRKRCWQHKGMRASNNVSYSSSPMYITGRISSNICGAALRNGSICCRTPVYGRKRCEQHKGMRAAPSY